MALDDRSCRGLGNAMIALVGIRHRCVPTFRYNANEVDVVMRQPIDIPHPNVPIRTRSGPKPSRSVPANIFVRVTFHDASGRAYRYNDAPCTSTETCSPTAPERLHDEVTADYTDMIYAAWRKASRYAARRFAWCATIRAKCFCELSGGIAALQGMHPVRVACRTHRQNRSRLCCRPRRRSCRAAPARR